MIYRRRYRWTEMSLLLFPAAFMAVALIELQLAQNAATPLTRNILNPLDTLGPAIGLVFALAVTHVLLNIFAPDSDQTLLPIAGTLASIGVIMAIRIGSSPGFDVPSLGAKQLAWVILGLGFCVGTVIVTRDLRWVRNYKYTWAVVGLALVGVTLVNAVRNFNTNAPSRDVLTIGAGGLSFQPSELVKICLVVFFAGYLSENQEMLTAGSIPVGAIKLPPLKQLGPLLFMLGLALIIAVGIRELGLALLIFGMVLSMTYAATSRKLYVIGGLALFTVGAVIAFSVFSYARVRLNIVSNAFDPNVATNSGYQIVQGLVAFGSGGVFGSGLGLGHPTFIPASNTDYIAAAFGEEFGFAGLLALLGLFMLLVFRGMFVALRSRDSFNQLMAVGLTSVFALQTLVILAGNLKLMPLTGVPLPFVAYGGSSVVANFIIIGFLLRLSEKKT
ncbi:MAG TPA: FtsW/RodA/SpoVE family cell cycle protein [Ktedonobacterales bacterium]|nr:FtsW/RodA/SpoVE family cell cycle protein [Ktedonobacterales bacterium]